MLMPDKTAPHIKNLIENLTVEKEFSEAIFNNIGSAVIVLDMIGAVLRINQAAIEVLKLKSTDMKDVNIREIDPELEKVLAASNNFDEIEIVTGDGFKKIIGFNNSPLLDQNRKQTGVIVVFRDLTEVINLRNELRKKQKFEEIGKLMSGVAHEVRNPLNAISALTEALSMDIQDNDDSRTIMGHIRGQVNRLSLLMSDLLDLGKPIDYSDMTHDSLVVECSAAIDLWRQSNPESSHKVNIIVPDNTNSCVLLNQQKMQQVFLNLIENAVQHSPEGSEVKIVFSEHNNSILKVQVIDRGEGISREYLPQVFEPFFTMRRGGTGLGLSIVHHVIEAHDGEIEICNNNPPPGCTVTARIPLVPASNCNNEE